jgi:hypothetical protein
MYVHWPSHLTPTPAHSTKVRVFFPEERSNALSVAPHPLPTLFCVQIANKAQHRIGAAVRQLKKGE